MFISSITLENIRSYTHQLIEFQEGINVLYGNIGSGKSTILLAIEVALFGLKKGEGSHIVRKGQDEAKVEVTFTHPSRDEVFTISRTFKKTKTGITQSSGYIKVNNLIEELSTQEMNMQIFVYCNFPISFVNKDKTLMYRFTHYTPQEQLKEILTTQADKRLEILRKVFNIDKYKQIQHAVSLTSKDYSKELIAITSKLEEIPQTLTNSIEEKKQELQQFTKEVEEIEEKKVKLQDKLKIVLKNKKQLEQKQSVLKEHIKQVKELEQEKVQCEKNAQNMLQKRLLSSQSIQKTQDEISSLKLKLKSHLNTINDISLEEQKTEEKDMLNNDIVSRVQVLDSVIETQERKIQSLHSELLLQEKEQLFIDNIKEKIQHFKSLEDEHILTQCKIKDLEVKVKKALVLEKKREKIEKHIKEISTKTQELENKKSFILRDIEKLQGQIHSLDLVVNNDEESIQESSQSSDIKQLCPTCGQEISLEHISHLKEHLITLKNSKELQEFDMKLKEYSIELEKLQLTLKEIIVEEQELLKDNFQLESLTQEEQKLLNKLEMIKEELELKILDISSLHDTIKTMSFSNKLFEIQKISYSEEIKTKTQKLNELQYSIDSIKSQKSLINSVQQQITTAQETFFKLEVENEQCDKQMQELKEKNEQLVQKLKALEQEIMLNAKIDEKISQQEEFEQTINEKLNGIISQISKIETQKSFVLKEITQLQELEEKKQTLTNTHTLFHDIKKLLQEDVTKICSILEETLFIEIHSDLSLSLEKYFKQLVDEDDLDVFVREDFSLTIEQNGYEIEVEQLSGGEKSALALSYRLALKEVIEKHFIQDTFLEFIILDEPTDGFSASQIQKFATILHSSNFKQIFLVSHDSNLLSSGEHVYTIEKEHHISLIVKS